MKELIINPIKGTITIKGHSFIDDQVMPLDDFKQLCFQNGWEGTLYKVMSAQTAFDDALWDAMNK